MLFKQGRGYGLTQEPTEVRGGGTRQPPAGEARGGNNSAREKAVLWRIGRVRAEKFFWRKQQNIPTYK
jgi:hypothetical protein